MGFVLDKVLHPSSHEKRQNRRERWKQSIVDEEPRRTASDETTSSEESLLPVE